MSRRARWGILLLIAAGAVWLIAGLTLGAAAPTLPAERIETSGDAVVTLRSAAALPARPPSEAPAPTEEPAGPAAILDVEVKVPGFEGEVSLQILDASHQATTTEALQVLGGRTKWSGPVGGEPAYASAEVFGRPAALAPIEWAQAASLPRRGRARLVIDALPGAPLTGRVVDPQGRAVSGIELIVSTAPEGAPILTQARRAVGQGRGHDAVTVRSDASGAFSIPGWGGAPAFVRVATYGWIRADEAKAFVEDGKAGELGGASAAAPVWTGAAGAERDFKTIVVSRIMELAFTCEFPEALLQGASDRELLTWINIGSVQLEPPPVPTVNMGYHSIGDAAQDSTPPHIYLGSKLAVDPTARWDDALSEGSVVVHCPGCRPARAPVFWRYRGEGEYPRVKLVPKAHGAAGMLRVTLTGAPAGLLDSGTRVWLSIRDVEATTKRARFERSIEMKGATATVPIPLVPGRYIVSSACAKESAKVLISSDAVTTVRVPLRPLCGVEIRWPQRLGLAELPGVLVTTPEEADLIGGAPASDLVMGLRAVIQGKGPDSKRFWFLRPTPLAIRFQLPGQQMEKHRVELEPGVLLSYEAEREPNAGHWRKR